MSHKNPEDAFDAFRDLHLSEQLLKTLKKNNYQSPTEIQTRMIPHLLEGRDVVGQAQTGTGKTAAFALPLLQNLVLGKKRAPQILVLAPTRELAIQVSESLKNYGQYLKGLSVLPIYGGQEYTGQLQQLRKGVHVVVGTPGRVMDHIRRKSLDLRSLTGLVLDEADEMLKMGFLEDVKWILKQTPDEKQIALFSATMPQSIRTIAKQHLQDPVEITVKSNTVTASRIEQQYLLTKGRHSKLESITRILEAEIFDGMLIFVRTKIQTVEIAEHLAAQGHNCGPLNGDIPQSQRLRMIDQLKSGKLDIVVATDVAARGLDVDRVSHVINYDIPYDTEAYIHRIGRTGRAGRTGKAILFIHPQEKKMLKGIERQTGGKITAMTLPTAAEINSRRIESFKNSITSALADDTTFFEKLIENYCEQHNMPPHLVAAALAKIVSDKTNLQITEQRKIPDATRSKSTVVEQKETSFKKPLATDKKSRDTKPEAGMDRYRIEIGQQHGVSPKNIVGAIANEAEIDSEYIGRISIFDDYSTVDLPYGMPRHILRLLQRVRIYDRMMKIRRENDTNIDQPTNTGRKKKGKKKSKSSNPQNIQPLSH